MTDSDKNTDKLTAEDWQHIKIIFNQLIEFDSKLAASKVDELCEKAPHIKPAVMQMLAVYQSSADETITPQQSAASVIVNQSMLKVGKELGKYTLIKLIGSGGMGQVYLAQRNDEVQQQVAIKVLNHYLLDEQSQIRFDIERRVLATLEHPNIARLIDADSEGNYAYFVMEYIEGLAIDQYCIEHKVSLAGRLDLFLKICAAVSYAHSNLIVHRDLKPDNILVTTEGELKLLDFGIAKPLKVLPGTESIHETWVGTTALTPQYAAPEQISGGTVNIACDIYALGLLLYQLLTDEHAFKLTDKTWGEIEHVIKHQMPTLPSKVLQKNQGVHTENTQHSWAKQLKGDLDAIVSHALKKEPSERYATVHEMAADLKRYLNHKPLQIKQSQTGYRLKKALRRHWMPVTAMAAVFTMLLVSTILIWQQSKTIKQERDNAITEKQVAEEVTEFLVDTFKAADPTQTMGTKLTAGDILEQGVKQIKQQQPSPKTKNRLLSTLAEVYMNLSAFDQAEILADQVDVLAFENLNDQINFAYTQAKINSEKGDIKAALRIIEANEPSFKEGESYFYTIMNLKAGLLKSSDRFAESIELAESLLANAENQFGLNTFNYAVQLRVYARQIKKSNNNDKVIEIYKRAIEIMEGLSNLPDKMSLLNTKEKLMAEYTSDQQYEKAIIISEDLEQSYLDIFSKNHVVFGPLYTTRGRIYANTDKPNESLTNHQKSYQIYHEAVGEESNKVARTEINMAVVYLYLLSDYNQAKILYESALFKFEKNAGKTNNYYYMRLPYAFCLIKLHQYNIAKAVIAESAKYYRERKEKSIRNIALAESLMAHIMIHEGEYAEAQALLERSKDAMIKYFGDTIHRDMIEKDIKKLTQVLGEKNE